MKKNGSAIRKLNADPEHQRMAIRFYNRKYHDKRKEYPSYQESVLRRIIENEFVEYEWEYETDAGWFDARVVYKGKTYLIDIEDKRNVYTKERDRRKMEWCKENGIQLVSITRGSDKSKTAVAIALLKIRG
jgi:hypothetical protein